MVQQIARTSGNERGDVSEHPHVISNLSEYVRVTIVGRSLHVITAAMT